jgi:hypothetical protein
MTDFLESISNFFARHRAHCSKHEVYQSDCAACVAANQSAYIDPGTDGTIYTGGDSFLSTDSSSSDSQGLDSPGADSPVADCSTTDSSSCDTSDFGGFDGGDSGGGGASGDF